MNDLTTIPVVWPGRSHAGLMLCLGDMRSIAPILLLSSTIGEASRRIAGTWPDEVARPYCRSWPICEASRPACFFVATPERDQREPETQ